MDNVKDKGCLYLVTRRIAIEYMDNDCKRGKISPELAYLDDLMSDKIKRYADKPFSDFTENDVFLLSGLDFTTRYENDVLPNKKEIMNKIPGDIYFYTDFIENVANRIPKISVYDNLDYNTLKKCMYMRNTVPSSDKEYRKDLVLTSDELVSLPQDVMKDMLGTIMDFDNAYGIYNLEYKKCNELTVPYIKYGNNDRNLLNFCQDTDKEEELVERD